MELPARTPVFILARGGSKGLPRKNVRDLRGKPLVAWTIQAALDAGHTPIVNTDDKEIAAIALEYGAEVPCMRPADLATDFATSIDVLAWLLGELYADNKPDWLMLLQPTSPLRTAEDIREALEQHQLHEAPVLSVCKQRKPPHWSLELDKNQRLQPFFGEQGCDNRQLLPKLYLPNGAIYILRTKDVLDGRPVLESAPIPYLMPEERSVDIDTELDWRIAAMLMSEQENASPG